MKIYPYKHKERFLAWKSKINGRIDELSEKNSEILLRYLSDMARKSITELIEEIKKLLEKEGELSTRQITLKTKTQWRTTKKALDTLRNLGIIKERQNSSTERDKTLYSINKIYK